MSSKSIKEILESSNLKFKEIKELGDTSKFVNIGDFCDVKVYKNGNTYVFQENDHLYQVKVDDKNKEDFICNLITFYLSNIFLLK